MSNERRYQDDEIREILDLAIGQDDAPAPSLPAIDGLTLLQLQEVGREVGLPPDRIAQAVAAFEGRGESVPRGTALGLPTSVGRVVPLPRSPSDREWELLIAELRTTFGGKGEVTSHGSLREWSHVRLAVPAFLSLLGVSLVVGSAISLPRWAREQERRMEHISSYAASLLALPGPKDD